jgi:putative ABC transport system permease protein
MFKNFLKTTVRNIVRHKGFALINIIGLSLGLTACLLIGLFVWDEKKFDRFVPEGERVYRIISDNKGANETKTMGWTPPAYAAAMEQSFPEVKQKLRILNLQSKVLIETGNLKIYEEGGMASEESFFEIFPLSLKYGSAKEALKEPNSIVLTEALSRKYFGDKDPVGKAIMLDKQPFVVRAVIADALQHFHLRLSYILPLSAAAIPPERMERWTWNQFNSYVKLKPGTDYKKLEPKFQKLVQEKSAPEMEPGESVKPFLQPLHKIHLYSSHIKFNWTVQGNILYVNALITIAVFILVIACFNFVNLATAKSLQRAREVGVRKSIGASRRQLFLQFTGETLVLTFFSILLSAGLVFLFLEPLNEFTGKSIPASLFSHPVFLLILLVLGFIVGVLAGFYPAWVLARFNAVKVLKGNSSSDASPGKIPWLRNSLVVVQFALSALLIVSAIVVFRQVNYLHNKELGFNKEQIMFFPIRGDKMAAEYASFKDQLLQGRGISSVSIGYGFPGDAVAGDQVQVPGPEGEKTHSATLLIGDHDYVSTLGLQLLGGRDFSRDIKTDADEAFIINETAVRQLGFGSIDKALGHPLKWKVWSNTNPDSTKLGKIIGVVKDFHYKSLYDKMETAVIQIFPPANVKVAVKMNSADAAAGIDHVKSVWKRFSPEYPIEYKFLDENFENMYESEDKLRTLLAIFTAIAISVGCMGLFGLAAYAAQRRIREIGIRKVLGASVNGLVILLAGGFIRLVLVALLIAIPVAGYLMNLWLEDFAYRIAVEWWVFALAAAIAIVIALLTVSVQAIRTALMNPVRSLRSE